MNARILNSATRTRAGTLAVAALIIALFASWAIGQTMVASARSTATARQHAAAGHVTAFAFIKIKDKHGHVIYKHTYPASTAGHIMHLSKKAIAALRSVSGPSVTGNEGYSSAYGTATAGVGQVGEGSIFADVIWEFDTYLNWHWNRANQNVNQISHSYDPYKHLDPTASFDGIVSQSHHFFPWMSTNLFANSGYHSMYQGKYSIPSYIHGIANVYPHNVLEVHSNGTWYWQHTCCGPPGH